MADRNEFNRQKSKGAYAGWGDTEAWADFSATGGQNVDGGSSGQINWTPEPFDYAKQTDEGANFRNRFSTWLGGLETPQQTRDKYSNMYGYADDKQKYQANTEAIGDVTAQISAIPGNVESRGGQTIMTQAQKANVVNQEVGKLMETYNSLASIDANLGKKLAMTEQNLNEAAQLEMARQQQQSTPWLQEYNDLVVNQARKFSGWTFANQLELDKLLANQNMTNADRNRASQLAIAEKGFQNELDKIGSNNNMYLEGWGLA